jgi:hypothetical protein
MSNLPGPTIADCKEIAQRFRKRGVLLLTVDSQQFCVTSYGMTAKQCRQLRVINDFLADAIERGEIDLIAFTE